MTNPSTSEVMFRKTIHNDVPNLARFAKEIFETEWSEEFIEWKYFSNPAGPFYGSCAEILDKPAGYYGNIPVRLKFGNSIGVAAQAVDAMILPEARRLGLFTQLNRKTYELMDSAGIILDYAFPNPQSEAGFVNRLNWTPVGHVPRYVKILDRSAFSSQNHIGRLKSLALHAFLAAVQIPARFHTEASTPSLQVRLAEPSYRFDQQADQLWARCAADFPIAVARSSTYLNWRYLDNPSRQYAILLAEQGTTLVGFTIVSFRDADSQHSAALVEWLFPQDKRAAGAALLAAVDQAARQRGCCQVQSWMLPQYIQYTKLLRQVGYSFSLNRYIPGFFRSTIPFIIRPLPNYVFSVDPSCQDNWYLTMGDHDYF